MKDEDGLGQKDEDDIGQMLDCRRRELSVYYNP